MSIAAEWATVVLAAVALAGLVLTLRTLATAEDDVRQSRYSRIDARAPRVIVRHARPPRLPAALAAKVVTGTIMELPYDQRFDLIADAEQEIRITCYVELLNEGAATAFVTLPLGGIAVAGDTARPDEHNPDLYAWAFGQRLRIQLEPGQSSWLLLEGDRTVTEWARIYGLHGGQIEEAEENAEDVSGRRFVIEVSDQFAEGVHDEITVDALALPIAPIQGTAGTWGPRMTMTPIGAPAPNATYVRPTVRHYPRSTATSRWKWLVRR